MRGPTSNADLDYLAREMGHTGGMAEVQEKRRMEEEAKRKAKLEAEEEANAEEQRQRTLAEDAEISAALRDRMTIMINGRLYENTKSHQDIVCPECGEPLAWARLTLLLCARRATLEGENLRPVWFRSISDIKADMVPTDQWGDGLRTIASSNINTGRSSCPCCEKPLDVTIETKCMIDGKPVKSIRKRGKE